MQHFIGCDMHTRNQVVAWIDEETGEIRKRRLEHGGEEVRKFYAQFPRGTVVGIEATFPAYWFERLLGELGLELWVGDAARTRASDVRYQKRVARRLGSAEVRVVQRSSAALHPDWSGRNHACIPGHQVHDSRRDAHASVAIPQNGRRAQTAGLAVCGSSSEATLHRKTRLAGSRQSNGRAAQDGVGGGTGGIVWTSTVEVCRSA